MPQPTPEEQLGCNDDLTKEIFKMGTDSWGNLKYAATVATDDDGPLLPGGKCPFCQQTMNNLEHSLQQHCITTTRPPQRGKEKGHLTEDMEQRLNLDYFDDRFKQPRENQE